MKLRSVPLREYLYKADHESNFLKLHLQVANDVPSVFRTYEISAIWWLCEQALYLGLRMYLGVTDEVSLLD
jgi:hypothetical protein